MRRPRAWDVVLLCGLLHSGCEPGQRDVDTPPGSLSIALEASVTSDVRSVRFDVVAFDVGCDGAPIATQTEPLALHAGSPTEGHAFSSSLFLLAPGIYRVCATPLSDEGPSADCSISAGLVSVIAGQTAQLGLTSQCRGNGPGGLGVVVALNHPPEINSLAADPSDHITVCESLTLSATATDPEGDDLTYQWALLSGSEEASLRTDYAQAVLSGPEGEYLIRLTVRDGKGGVATLSIPAHISSETCSVPPEVANLFVEKCTPCHTTNNPPSAGMRLAPADAAYENLVLRSVAGAACTESTRVIPGDASSSYIIAKLRGLPGICGVQMPRGRPPLTESEIAIVEGWINSLPH